MRNVTLFKRLGLVAVFVAEALVVAAIAYAGSRLPADGIAVGADDAIIEVVDQRVAGAFSIARVVTPTDGWVIVRALRDGRPAELLGATRIESGESTSVAVPVDRTRALPAEAQVSLLADKGQIGVFEYTTGESNDAVVGAPQTGGGMGMSAGTGPTTSAITETLDKPLFARGEPVAASLGVTPFATVYKPTEAWIGTAFVPQGKPIVVVQRIIAPEQSWVAIVRIRKEADEANEVVAYFAVPEGTTAEVAGEFTGPMDGDLTAVLCADLGTVGVFELDPTNLARGPDSAYLALSYFVQVPVARNLASVPY